VNAEIWAEGAAYERYIGRWSRPVARQFVPWLDVAPGSAWLDLGSGTGALVDAILGGASPRSVLGIDRSPGFLARARDGVTDPRASFVVGDAMALAVEDDAFDAVVSGLVINFVDDPAAMAREMIRAARPDGTIAVYVWDYAGRMDLIRAFWDAARSIDPSAAERDQGERFPLCRPDRLEALLAAAGATGVVSRAIDIATRFDDFDDFWLPFLGGQGPAPAYAMALSEPTRVALRERLRHALPTAADGSITLLARAWAAKGRTPGGGPLS
jgi:SAM-dependent methyltransferase